METKEQEQEPLESFHIPTFEEQEKMTVTELTILLLRIEKIQDSLKRFIRSKIFN